MIRTYISRSRTATKRLSRPSSSFSACEKSDFERPTPIVLLTGEGCNVDMWSSFSLFLSSRGYSGVAIEYPVLGNFEEKYNTIYAAIQAHKFTPPVVIAHSVSTFVMQKYLESHALSGLVLVNPLPVNSVGLLASLSQRWAHCSDNTDANSRNCSSSDKSSPLSTTIDGCTDAARLQNTLCKYYGIVSPAQKQLVSPSSAALHHYILNRSVYQPYFKNSAVLQGVLDNEDPVDNVVNLERGAVPTLLVTSSGDCGLLSTQQRDQLAALHSVSPEDCLHFAGGGSGDLSGDLSGDGGSANFHSDSVEYSAAASKYVNEGMGYNSAVPGSGLSGGSRAPMLTHGPAFNAAVFNWIESIT